MGKNSQNIYYIRSKMKKITVHSDIKEKYEVEQDITLKEFLTQVASKLELPSPQYLCLVKHKTEFEEAKVDQIMAQMDIALLTLFRNVKKFDLKLRILLHKSEDKKEVIFLDTNATWGNFLCAAQERFGTPNISFYKTSDNEFDNPKLDLDHSIRISELGNEFDYENDLSFDGSDNECMIISHGKDRQIIVAGKVLDLCGGEVFKLKLDNKRFNKNIKILRIVTEVVAEREYYKVREYRILDPGKIIIGSEEESEIMSVRVEGQEESLISKPITELDLKKNEKILKSVGDFTLNLVKKIVEGAVKGAVGGSDGAASGLTSELSNLMPF